MSINKGKEIYQALKKCSVKLYNMQKERMKLEQWEAIKSYKDLCESISKEKQNQQTLLDGCKKQRHHYVLIQELVYPDNNPFMRIKGQCLTCGGFSEKGHHEFISAHEIRLPDSAKFRIGKNPDNFSYPREIFDPLFYKIQQFFVETEWDAPFNNLCNDLFRIVTIEELMTMSIEDMRQKISSIPKYVLTK